MNFKKTYSTALYILLFGASASTIMLMNGCNGKTDSSTSYTLTGDTIKDGQNLVQLNCTKCHDLVPYSALNKNVWEHHTLPSMGHYLGVSRYLGGYYKGDKDTSGLSLQQWQAIVAYYHKMAPDTLLPAKKPMPLANDWTSFTVKKPAPGKFNSYTTLAAVDENNHKIYTSDYATNKLTEWDQNLMPREGGVLPSTAVNAIFDKNGGVNNAIISCIGEFQPVDFPNGRVLRVNTDAKDNKTNQTLVASELARPVQTLQADFNNDGLQDLVILAQGNLKGGIYLLKQNADHGYSQSTISEQAGAVQAISGDFDKDGWTDLMVLFGHGDEGLWLFLNDHKGGFTAKNLLRFPPVYGSTSIQIADVDHDGNPDVIYTCGYNFRDSRILKPYHGLYIFKNTGNWNLKQQWFYPINGCTKAIIADFKGNGHMDIVTSAFFADLKDEPEESVIYFEQGSGFDFKPHAIPVSKYGRWMTMDVADFNGDGKPDIVLGNYAAGFEFQNGLKPFWDKNTPFIVLQNNFKK